MEIKLKKYFWTAYLIVVVAFGAFCFNVIAGPSVTGGGGGGGSALSEEQVEDFVGGMLGGTETGISVAYNDEDNDIDFVLHAALQSIFGLTEADVSIIEQTGADTYNVVTSGGNNYILGSDDDNSDLEFKTPAAVLSEIGAQPLDAQLTALALGQLGADLDTNGNSILVQSGDVIRPEATTDGNKVIIQAYNGSSWVSAIEIANTAAAPITVTIPSSAEFITGPVSLLIKEYNSDELNDTSTPHLLTAAEVSGTVINNYDSSAEAKEYDLPAAAAGYNFILVLGLAQNVTIDPNGSEVVYLNGAALTAGNSVTNAAPTIGEAITFYTIQTGASAWGWAARSADSDFADLGS